MNIAFDLFTFNPLCVHFMDKKANNIIQGIFTKLIYSTDFYSMIGIYIKVPMKYIDDGNKQHLQINYSNIKNGKILHGIVSIEEKLLELYKKYTNNTKQAIYSLNTQLLYGSLKIYKENNYCENIVSNSTLFLKIAGIWENETHYGITFKFIY